MMDGTSAGPIRNVTAFAADLAGFLAALHAIDATDGPRPGMHNFFRGGPLERYDGEVRESIRLLAGEIDVEAASETWEAALTSRWDGPPVWVHGDVVPSNLLVRTEACTR